MKDLITAVCGRAMIDILPLKSRLFELGKQYLSAEQLTAMGKIMFARRQA